MQVHGEPTHQGDEKGPNVRSAGLPGRGNRSFLTAYRFPLPETVAPPSEQAVQCAADLHADSSFICNYVPVL